MAHHDEASTHRRNLAAVVAPEFLEVSDHEVSTRARRVPGYGLAPYTQQSSHQGVRERTEHSSHAYQAELREQRETLEDLPRKRTPRATPEPFSAHEPRSSSASSSRSTAQVAPAPFTGRTEGSGPKPIPSKPVKPVHDVAPPSIYPTPKVISPGKADKAGDKRAAAPIVNDVAPPSAYPEPKVISPGKSDKASSTSSQSASRSKSASQSAASQSAPSQTRAGSPVSKREHSQPAAAPAPAPAPAPAAAAPTPNFKAAPSPFGRAAAAAAPAAAPAPLASEPKSRSASQSQSQSKSKSRSASKSSSKSAPSSSAKASAPQLPPPPEAAAAAAPEATGELPPGMIDPLTVPVPPEMAATIYGWIRRLALQNDLQTADRVMRDALIEMTSSLSCTIIYPGQDGLWTLGPDEEIPKDTNPIVACAQVRRALVMSHTAMIPIVTTSETVGVILLQRNPRNPAYHPLEQIAALGFIREAAAILHHLAIAYLQKQHEIQLDKGSLYRGEALEAHRTRGNEGVLVHLSPGWVRRTYPFLLAAIAIALVFTAFIKVPTYSTGQAVMVIDGTPVTAGLSGNVSQLFVKPNQKVKKGSLILKFSSQAERNELEDARKEEDAYTTQYLFDQTDVENKKALIAASQKVQAAKKRIELKTIRAPEDGVVSDIRAREGELLNQGEAIATILPEGAEVTVVTFLNATDRPRLRKGMNMKVNLTGYTKSPETAKIIEVGNDAIAPEAAQKYLGTTLGGALKLNPGSYVVVKAKMPTRTFQSQKETLYYHHGMGAKVDVLINEKPFLVTLIPALEKYLVD